MRTRRSEQRSEHRFWDSCCPLGACSSGWPGVGGPWGARPTGVVAGGAVVHWGRAGPAGTLPRVRFELGAPGLGALRLCLFSILGSYPPSRRRQTISESSDRLSTAVQMSRAAFGAPGCFARAGGASVSTALKGRHSSKDYYYYYYYYYYYCLLYTSDAADE